MIAKRIRDNELYMEYKQKLKEQNIVLNSDDESGL